MQMADEVSSSSAPSRTSGRRARRAKNLLLHVDRDLRLARRQRKSMCQKWRKTDTEDQRRQLADELLDAMNEEDRVAVPLKGDLYKSWIDRRRAGDYVASVPITLLPVSLLETSMIWYRNLTLVDKVHVS
jgi:hypothetical protein